LVHKCDERKFLLLSMKAKKELGMGIRSYSMHSTKPGSRGFTLIAALLLLVIMSGIAIGLLMMVDTESRVGAQDTQNSLAFHAAEGGIEHMTSDLANMFQNIESPTAAQIQALSALAPANGPYMSYPIYTLTPSTNANGTLSTSFGQISAGTYQGLYAQLLPVNLQVTAITSLAGLGQFGDEVNMSRTVEVALIPVFQFGVFSDSDLGFYSSPNLNFAGRVHTNGDLYLGVANCCTLTFHDKMTAYGNVIRQVLPNGLAANAFNDSGVVLIPTTTQGCDPVAPPPSTCRPMAATEGSVTGAGGNPPASGPTVGPPSWQTISLNSAFYNGFIKDGDWGNTALGTGATNLTLPFVNGTLGPGNGPQPFEIVRRPPPGEVSTSALGASRLYNEAEIRVLISDTPADLPFGVGDPNNIRLANVGAYANGVAASTPVLPGLASGGTYNTYFATGTTAYPDTSTWTNALFPEAGPSMTIDWPYLPVPPIPADVTLTNDPGAPVIFRETAIPAQDGLNGAPPPVALTPCVGTPPVCPAAPSPKFYNAPYPFYTPPVNASTWNFLDGYIRVEYRDVNGNYHPVTAEWLSLGFARGTTSPTVAGGNPINPNAILIFQAPADRNGDGVIDQKGAVPGPTASCVKVAGVWSCPKAKPPEVTVDQNTFLPWYGDSKAAPSLSMYNWYPINFYDPREGEPRDTQTADNSCTPNGVMNAVELDVGNLKRWLTGATGTNGPNVDFIFQNGYVLYFSDRRGMLPNPNGTQVAGTAGTKTGDSGLEDAVNSNSAAGNPDGVLDAVPPNKAFSPEDTNLNKRLDNFGAGNIGLGVGYVPIPGTVAGTPYVAATGVNSRILGAAPAPDPYLTGIRMPACTIGRKNWVSGARHVLKLVDGTLGNVPIRPDNNKGGFTVGSENPVYIVGDYNTNAADPSWQIPPGADQPGMAAAGIVADAVTVLSNAWSDVNSMSNVWPTNPYSGNNSIGFNVPAPARTAATTYYRVAVAAGKSVNFPFPAWENNNDYGFGTDGGVHNFLRFLEDWGGQTLNYQGSLVSLYYSSYNTGTFKCCNYSVYTPPVRNYVFDPDFTQPQNLPPGTPLFRDIDNLSYRQSFTPHTGCY
jgi:hypothetical protein